MTQCNTADKYLVVNENALCYRIPGSVFLGVLAGSILRGGPNRMTGTMATSSLDAIRPATLADFDAFRVCHKGHLA